LKSGEIIRDASLDNEMPLEGFLALRWAICGADQQNAVRYINLSQVEEMTMCTDTLRAIGPEDIIRPHAVTKLCDWNLQPYED
jgi:hypothetical protein